MDQQQQPQITSNPSDRSSGTIHLTASADGILDVTPVNTFDYDTGSYTDSYEVVHQPSVTAANDTKAEDDDDEKRQAGGDEEEEESSEEEQAESEATPNLNDWDKALRSGKESRGKAAAFFHATTTNNINRSYDSSRELDSPQRVDSVGRLEKEDLIRSRSDSVATNSEARRQQQQQQQPPPTVPASSPSFTSTSLKQSPSNSSNYTNNHKPPTAPPRSSVASSASSTVSHASTTVSSQPNHARSNAQQQQLTQPQQPKQPPPSRPNSTIPTANSWQSTLTDSSMRPHPADDHLSSGVLPDVLMTMRLNLESLALFDSDMMRIASDQDADPMVAESRESLKRSSQQSISAAVLVSLAHKRYERRRLAAMEIEKVVRSLVHQNEIERVRAILLLLSDDYVRSTSEDARKGGVVALAACAIGLKKANDLDSAVQECRDLILASVVHACQDHSQRVRYYATESLFNVVKVIPTMAVQHFFILFEILRSLYADVDVDVRSGAELLDRKLKEVIVGAINAGTFTAEDCIPVFARFVYMRNKATKRLTLTWLQELNEKLVTAPILEFLHLFLGGIFDMIADPTQVIRQSALAFLHSVLPKLLSFSTEQATTSNNNNGSNNNDGEPAPTEEESSKAGKVDSSRKVDFDKILQSLVTTMEHPDPFVRKVAMYWMSRIVRAHVGETEPKSGESPTMEGSALGGEKKAEMPLESLSPAALSVRNSLPHILPGILLRSVALIRLFAL